MTRDRGGLRAIQLGALLLMALGASGARAAEEGEGKDKSIRAVRASTPPRIDGRLDDAVWATALADDRFAQVYPAEGQGPTERTEVRVLYDDDALYVGVRLLDSDPSGIVARMTRRDNRTECDWVVINIDSQLDHRTGFEFQLNAAGVQSDGLIYDDNNFSPEWDAVWEGQTQLDAHGWSAEFRIPLSALRFRDSVSQEWGFQVVRHVFRKQETSLWTFIPSTVNAVVSRFGHLTGMEGLRPRRTFELRPFVLVRGAGSSDSGFSLLGFPRAGLEHTGADAGLDARLALTPDLMLGAAVNPDFGQVEADQLVLNLTRFSSFFPEKRPFFLEGMDAFETPNQILYSRRVGELPVGLVRGETFQQGSEQLRVLEAANAARLWTAARLTGNVGPQVSLGVLGALSGAEAVRASGEQGSPRTVRLAPMRSQMALRGRYSLGGASYVGAMGTAVTRLGGGDVFLAERDHDAYTQSVDGQWQSRDSLWRLTGQMILTERVGGPGVRREDGTACEREEPGCEPITRQDGTVFSPGDVGAGATLRMQYSGLFLVGDASYEAYSPRFELNDMGYSVHFNKHRASVSFGYRDNQVSSEVLRKLSVVGFGEGELDFTSTPLLLRTGLRSEVEWHDFTSQTLELGVEPGGMWDPYETLDGARFQRASGLFASTEVTTDVRNPLRLQGSWSGRAGFDGSLAMAAEAKLVISALPRLDLELGPGWTWEPRSLRFAACRDAAGSACVRSTAEREYLFGNLDSSSLSFVARATWTFSLALSLQAYAQVFATRGQFSDFQQLTALAPRPFLRREALRPSSFDGDFDGDGAQDPGFQDTSLNLSLVLRWEYLPGSTLLAVYSRQQSAQPLLSGPPVLRLSGLSTGPTEDLLLLKLSYFWG